MHKKWFVFILIILCSCTSQDKPAVSFYYWKTVFKLSTIEKKVLKDNNVSKLYIRYFDIDIDRAREAFPVSPIHFTDIPELFTVVPVVYIKNKVLLESSTDVEELAQKVNDYINQINAKNNLHCDEIQIDCDWSLESQNKYLAFIKTFKKISGRKLSATIRLHQVKYYKKTKIPDVDSGVLMYYNMGTIATDSTNSIYDQKIAKRYLSSLEKYPLKLNFALPVFSWTIHSRDKKVVGLRNKLRKKDLDNDAHFKELPHHFYEVIADNYKGGIFYRQGDLLKVEAIAADDLLEMASDLENNKSQLPKEIIFYDLDEFNIQQYEKNIFEKIISRF
ncbi:hypothetical protein [Flavobacterium algicola]|uniref:hypothetical protein n=1 Tax=Flavobacterium algicola TaxID=556529 RepID=UPI001EFD439D|nr:hypothetical protein [Flavobacterium algicola]MCG9792089.1 hypothetical protein [Flavobacterium algicola]